MSDNGDDTSEKTLMNGTGATSKPKPQNETLGAQGGLPDTPLNLKQKLQKLSEQEKLYLETTHDNLDDDFGSEEKLLASTSNYYKTKYLQNATYERLLNEIQYSISERQRQQLIGELNRKFIQGARAKHIPTHHKSPTNNSHPLSIAQSPKNIAAYLSMVNSFTSDDPIYLATDYFDSVERVAEMHNLADDVKLNIAKLRLRDKALNFARKGKLLDIHEYDTFKEQMISRFQPFEDLESARARLVNSIQLPNETVNSYENRIFLDIQESLPRDVTPTKREQLKELFELQALSAFINGLHPEIAPFVRYKEPVSLSDAAYYAKLEEHAIETRKRKLALINPNLLPDIRAVELKPISSAKINYAGADRFAAMHNNHIYSLGDQAHAGAHTDKNISVLAARQPDTVAPLIATRDCINATNPNTCACHLRTFNTSFPGVFETKLCKNECPIHFPFQKSSNNNNPYNANNAYQQNRSPNNTYRNNANQYNNTYQQRPNNKYPQQYANHPRSVTNQPPQNRQYQSPNNTCLSCGLQGHLRSNCRFYTARCNNCSLMGHIARVCQKPSVNPGAATKEKTQPDRLAAILTRLENLNITKFSNSSSSSENTKNC